ncbi:MAG: hypothetical protein IJ735_02380 [Clostridia bacterium]|nr:hypothetical protein [Clostridia bacterium]
MKNGKIIITNVIIVLVAVAAIVTLWLGSFMQIDLSLTVNQKNVEEIAGEEADVSALGEFSITIPLSLTLKDSDGISAIFGDRTAVTKQVVEREISSVLQNLFSAAKDVMKTVTKAVVNKAVDEAKNAIEKQLGEGTDTQKVLEEQYGVSGEDIETFKTELSDTITLVLDGGSTDDLKAKLEDSETLDKILEAYAEAELKEKLGVDTLDDEQKAQAAANAEEKKNEVLDKYDEVIEQFADEEGNLSVGSIVAGMMDEAGIKDDNGDKVKIETEEDLKNFISEKINGTMEENTEYIGYALMGLGVFVLFVMACWAYVILKIIIKLFMKNKTVFFGLPQAFGWMPHVFFIGLPMTIIRLSDVILPKLSDQLGEDATKVVKMAQNMVSLNVSSLTWVSALCTVVLLIISFFYYKWRRQIKKELKSGK